MSRRSPGFLLPKAVAGFLLLRQGGGSSQLHDAWQLRAYPQTVARPQCASRVTRVAFDVRGVETSYVAERGAVARRPRHRQTIAAPRRLVVSEGE
jgi:hypothetical protein